MSLEIGPTPPPSPGWAISARPVRPSFQATLAAVEVPDRGDVAEVGVPEEARAAVGVAADRVDELAAVRRELHFERDEDTGRVIVQVRDLDSGEVVRTIPAASALDVLSGGGL